MGSDWVTRADIAAVRAYAEAQTESFAGFRLGGRDGTGLSVAFTGDPEPHRAALSAALRNPAGLVLDTAPYSRREMDSIRDELRSTLSAAPGRPMQGIGVGYMAVDLKLRAPCASLAAELSRRYGQSLEIVVGFKRFPPARPAAALSASRVPEPTFIAPELLLTIELERDSRDSVEAGEDVRGKVWIANGGRSEVLISTDSIVSGGVKRSDLDSMSGNCSGALAGTGAEFLLSPGERASLALVVGTACCEPNDLYVPAPGIYEVMAPVPLHLHNAASVPRRQLVAKGATLTLR